MQTRPEPETCVPLPPGPAIPISLGAVCSLTGWSERTAWRRLASGSIVRIRDAGSGNRVLIAWPSIAPHVRLELDDAGLRLLSDADAGNAEAQNDLALRFLQTGLPASAVYWLQQAARCGHRDAMHWLARCYISGDGIARDRNLGLMWLARAAAAGHRISDAMLHALCERFCDEPV